MNGTRTRAICIADAMRAQAFALDTFEAWKLGEGRSYPIDLGSVEALADVINIVAPKCGHKQKFVIRQTSKVSGAAMLHFYAIKQKAATYRHSPETKQAERYTPQYADLLLSMPVKAFEPLEAWTWAPGADVVGQGDGVIEGSIDHA